MTCSFNVKDGKLVNVQYDGGEFDCSKKLLTSLKGCPQEVGDCFDCSENQLTSLEGCPEKVEGYFYCFENQLTSLNGGPKEVGGNFYCSGNQLTSLKGCSQEVGGGFYCSENQLTSLEGCPKKVGGNFVCWENQLTSLNGCPQKVGGDFYCSNNPNLEDISDLPSSCRGIDIDDCPKITKFPAKIDDTLCFEYPTEEVRQRIKQVSFYEVVEEDEKNITVRQKRIGAQLLDEL